MKKLIVIFLLCVNFCFGQTLNGINTTPTPSYLMYTNLLVQSSPADGATNYIGGGSNVLSGVSFCGQQMVPVNSTLIGWSCVFLNGASPTNEASSIFVQLNGSATTLTNNLVFAGATTSITVTGLTVNVPANTYINTKFIWATWATNPTNVAGHVTYYLKVNQ